MSRPVVRVTVSTLIALILLVAVFSTVQGALLSRDQAAGVNHSLSRNRPTIDGPNASSEQQLPADPHAPKQGEGGGCDHEAEMDLYD